MIKMINPTREAIVGTIEFCYRLKWRTGMKPNGCDLEVKIKADCGFNSSHKMNRFGKEGRIAFDHYVFQQRLIHSISFKFLRR